MPQNELNNRIITDVTCLYTRNNNDRHYFYGQMKQTTKINNNLLLVTIIANSYFLLNVLFTFDFFKYVIMIRVIQTYRVSL